MKTTDSKKLDQIITMLGDVVEVFGKRFDKIDRDMATKEHIVALHTQLNGIETDIKTTKGYKLPSRMADVEEELFGKSRG